MKEIKRSVCPLDCPDTCSILATVDDGRIVELQGDREHPFTAGYLCGKVSRYHERVYSPDRLLYPQKRTGPKGKGQFKRISWDEALDTIALNFSRIARHEGPEAILPYSYGGTMGVVQRNAGHRFFHRLGASRLARTICSPAASLGFNATVGASLGPDPESVTDSDCIIIWGQNTAVVNLHLMTFVKQARRAGATLTVIDPYRNDTARLADRHIRPLPGTDAALALGLMYVMIEEDWIDHAYIDKHTVGYEPLRSRVLTEYHPGRVAGITGVKEEDLRSLARKYSHAGAPFIRIGDGLSRHTNGAMAVRSIACLAGLVGAFGKKGGSALQSTSGAFKLNDSYIQKPELSANPARRLNMIRLGEILTSDLSPRFVLFTFITATLRPLLRIKDGFWRVCAGRIFSRWYTNRWAPTRWTMRTLSSRPPPSSSTGICIAPTDIYISSGRNRPLKRSEKPNPIWRSFSFWRSEWGTTRSASRNRWTIWQGVRYAHPHRSWPGSL